jgi:hypothetical protein
MSTVTTAVSQAGSDGAVRSVNSGGGADISNAADADNGGLDALRSSRAATAKGTRLKFAEYTALHEKVVACTDDTAEKEALVSELRDAVKDVYGHCPTGVGRLQDMEKLLAYLLHAGLH